MNKRTWLTSLSAACLCAGFLIVTPQTVIAAEIPEGVYAGSQSLGGKTKEEANQVIQEYIDSLANQTITLEVDGEPVETTASELGFYWSNADEVDQIVADYTEGNLIQQYLRKKDLEQENLTLPLETAVDETKVSEFVTAKCEGITAKAQDASIIRENGEFVVTPSVIGKTVDVAATKAALDTALEAGLEQPVTVAAVITEEQPAITTEDLSTISDVLGTYTTAYKSSGASRSTNISVGAGKINGRVLMPGETLSGYECMHPFTRENGYAAAGAYENGIVIDSIGGGVCQISTTLYNASLLAELEIVQRQNHSMTVSYVKPSMDAAIAGTYKDLKITNNYSTPIYVEGYTKDKEVTFTIYGKETRPANRTIKFVSETLGTVDPGAPTEKVDNSLAPGTRKQVQSAHRGVKSRLWKYVYVDGVETEKTILHTDNYNASKAIVLVGPAVPTAEIPAESQPAVIEGVDGGPGVVSPQAEPSSPSDGGPGGSTGEPTVISPAG